MANLFTAFCHICLWFYIYRDVCVCELHYNIYIYRDDFKEALFQLLLQFLETFNLPNAARQAGRTLPKLS